jgi:2-polyprenyl-3-methyl-5-hydroxy-6-metoxy-1,4-benzoquinol methylase
MNEQTFRTQIAHSSREVIAFYDRYAATWDERFGGQRSVVDFHRLRLQSFLRVADLKKTDRLVELGVGTGAYLEALTPLVKELIAIDGSAQMLEVLQARRGNLSNIKLLQVDLEQPSQDVAFQADLVYCFGLLEHIIDVQTFLLNCKKMLKRKGRLVLVLPNGKCPWYGGMRRLWRAGRHCSSDRYYTRAQLDDLMRQYGFTPEAAVYWGYYPPGVGSVLFWSLRLIGRLIEKTWLRQYAGGLTASYILHE